jgi:hypothetical protein
MPQRERKREREGWGELGKYTIPTAEMKFLRKPSKYALFRHKWDQNILKEI